MHIRCRTFKTVVLSTFSLFFGEGTVWVSWAAGLLLTPRPELGWGMGEPTVGVGGKVCPARLLINRGLLAAVLTH